MSDLTISQCLRKIKKLKGELSMLTIRAHDSVTYAAAKEPAFKFAPTMERLDEVRAELLSLQARLATTNALTKLSFRGKEMTLMEATRRLEEIKGKISFYETLPVRDHEKVVEQQRDYNEDMKLVLTTVEYRCDLPKQKQAALVAALKNDFEELNDEVETTNHRTSLKG